MIHFALSLVHLLDLHLLELVKDDLVLLAVLHVQPDVQVVVPVAGVEAPVAGLLLEGPVHVTHELLGREPAVALQALDAGRLLEGVHVRGADALALAEALVVHPEAEGPLRQALDRDVAAVPLRTVEQGGAQPLGIGAGDQAAGLHVRRQDLGRLELHQLGGCALRAVYAQVVEAPVDLLQREVVQDVVEKLWQAEPHLAAHRKAAYGLALQLRLVQLAASRVRHREDRLGQLPRRGGGRVDLWLGRGAP